MIKFERKKVTLVCASFSIHNVIIFFSSLHVFVLVELLTLCFIYRAIRFPCPAFIKRNKHFFNVENYKTVLNRIIDYPPNNTFILKHLHTTYKFMALFGQLFKVRVCFNFFFFLTNFLT